MGGRDMFRINGKIVTVLFCMAMVLLLCLSLYGKFSKTIYYVIPVMLLLFCIVWFIETFKFRKFGGAFTFQYLPNPNPGITLLKSLEESGYTVKDISYIKMMCYDLSSNYIRDFIHTLTEKNSLVTIDLCGYGTKFKVNGSVNFLQTKMPLEEHINIIGMKDGKTSIWYEPVHTIYNGKDSLPEGAFYSLNNISREKAESLFEKMCKHKEESRLTIFKTAYNVVKSSLLYPSETTFISPITGNIIRVTKDKHA
ncbi:membrane protein [Candidatus Magnetobacterium bavaricum]|uniref:Membrane protein n=1 Tax=Candidatus Magnetobacterium bavaricum TaxID=29290 RepID=A0A0F3GT37_9BACT|nr:membrane protein [Candidatus Magnetobacterium bavaricum]